MDQEQRAQKLQEWLQQGKPNKVQAILQERKQNQQKFDQNLRVYQTPQKFGKESIKKLNQSEYQSKWNLLQDSRKYKSCEKFQDLANQQRQQQEQSQIELLNQEQQRKSQCDFNLTKNLSQQKLSNLQDRRNSQKQSSLFQSQQKEKLMEEEQQILSIKKQLNSEIIENKENSDQCNAKSQIFQQLQIQNNQQVFNDNEKQNALQEDKDEIFGSQKSQEKNIKEFSQKVENINDSPQKKQENFEEQIQRESPLNTPANNKFMSKEKSQQKTPFYQKSDQNWSEEKQIKSQEVLEINKENLKKYIEGCIQRESLKIDDIHDFLDSVEDLVIFLQILIPYSTEDQFGFEVQDLELFWEVLSELKEFKLNQKIIILECGLKKRKQLNSCQTLKEKVEKMKNYLEEQNFLEENRKNMQNRMQIESVIEEEKSFLLDSDSKNYSFGNIYKLQQNQKTSLQKQQNQFSGEKEKENQLSEEKEKQNQNSGKKDKQNKIILREINSAEKINNSFLEKVYSSAQKQKMQEENEENKFNQYQNHTIEQNQSPSKNLNFLQENCSSLKFKANNDLNTPQNKKSLNLKRKSTSNETLDSEKSINDSDNLLKSLEKSEQNQEISKQKLRKSNAGYVYKIGMYLDELGNYEGGSYYEPIISPQKENSEKHCKSSQRKSLRIKESKSKSKSPNESRINHFQENSMKTKESKVSFRDFVFEVPLQHNNKKSKEKVITHGEIEQQIQQNKQEKSNYKNEENYSQQLNQFQQQVSNSQNQFTQQQNQRNNNFQQSQDINNSLKSKNQTNQNNNSNKNYSKRLSPTNVNPNNVRIEKVLEANYNNQGNFVIYEINPQDAKKMGLDYHNRKILTPLTSAAKKGREKEVEEIMRTRNVVAYLPLNSNIQSQLELLTQQQQILQQEQIKINNNYDEQINLNQK